jgi:hypothetical protein
VRTRREHACHGAVQMPLTLAVMLRTQFVCSSHACGLRELGMFTLDDVRMKKRANLRAASYSSVY